MAAPNTTIEGNVISDSQLLAAIFIAANAGTATGTIIQGNFIGTNAAGTVALPNVREGINDRAGDTTIGGTTSGAGNVISGNDAEGIVTTAGFAPDLIEGNLIGTNAAGTAAIPNLGGGIVVDVTAVIGGTGPGAGNVISGNLSNGISIATSGVVVEGNLIGTDATGNSAIPNQNDGIDLVGSFNTIGGTTAGARNLISGNRVHGVEIFGDTTGNLVQGNSIGTNLAGSGPLGNAESGLYIKGVRSNATIGGEAAGAGNTIAYNGAASQVTRGDSGAGVDIVSGVAETVLSNSIYSNSGLSIDLGNDGPTANDPLDLDSGPNNLQNFPIITAATITGSSTTITGTLNSTPNITFVVQFFGNDVAGALGFGEGQNFLGLVSVPTDANGNGSFNIPFAGAPSFVAATATDPSGNTSEFSLDLATTVSMADLSVTLAAAPNPVIAGTDLTYKLTVHTGGPSDALGVIASDTLPTGTSFVSASGDGTLNNGAVTWNLGTIAAGAADTTLTLVVLVNAAQTAGLSDTANVASTTPDPVSANNNATATTTVTPATNAPADLSLTVLANSNSVVVGQDVTYTLVVHIAGQSDALGVIVTDPLPAGTSFVSASGGGTFKNGTTIWDLGTIAAGSPDTTLTLVIQVNAAQPTGLANTAFVSSSTSDPVPGNNSGTAKISVTPAPDTSADLAISNSDSPNPVIVGSDLTYTLTVYAAGPSSALDVIVTDQVPAGTTFVSASGDGTLSNGTVTWDFGTIAAGARTRRRP